MPVLIVDGLIQGAHGKTTDAGPCEWCGVLLRSFTAWDRTPDSPVLVQHVPDDIPRAHMSQYVVITRLCQECAEISWRLGQDGLEEGA
jgi:hypothetical protein